MKKLFLLALLPMWIACNKSSNLEVIPQQQQTTLQNPEVESLAKNTAAKVYQLISFTIKAKANVWSPFFGYVNTVKLTWNAKNETMIVKYEVQHALNGGTWYDMGTWQSSGNNVAITRQYNSFGSVPAGNNSYRLKIFHTNNTTSYSNVLNATF